MQSEPHNREPIAEDRFRQAAHENRTLFCAWLTVNSPLLVDGEAGWDCILIDQQHGLGGHDAMVDCLTAAKAAGNVVLHKGFFDAKLPGFVARLTEPVALLHIDWDIYSSRREVFRALGGHLVPGTIIVFDEYFGFYGWKRHEFLAFQEFVAEHGIEYEYVAYTFDQQAAVRILKHPAAKLAAAV